MGGATTSGALPTNGTLYSPATANVPGARRSAIGWGAPSGAMWLFGGYGVDGAGVYHHQNDVWRLK